MCVCVFFDEYINIEEKNKPHLYFTVPVSFGALAWQFYELPANWSLGSELLRHTFGLVSHFRIYKGVPTIPELVFSLFVKVFLFFFYW